MKINLCIFLLLLSLCIGYSQEKLEVEGAIIIENNSDPNPKPGTIRWTGQDFEGYTNTGWKSLTLGNNTVIPCTSKFLASNETGSYIWCWDDIALNPNTSGPSTTITYGLRVSQEWNYDLATIVDGKLRMYVDPVDFSTTHTPSRNGDAGNKRSEVFEASDGTFPSTFTARKPAGTDEWLGWSVTFGDNYVPMTQYHWLFYQNKPDDADSPGNYSPPFSLNIAGGVYSGVPASVGEIVFDAEANDKNGGVGVFRTGVVPVAGQTIKIVVHTIYGEGTSGTSQVWIDGVLVVDQPNIATLYTPTLGGGTNKFGVYNWNWGIQSRLNDILAQGVSHLELLIGNIKGERWQSGDAQYGTNRYNFVVPD